MSVADELLKSNEEFARNFKLGELSVRPQRHVAVLACMEEALADQAFVRESVAQAKRACRQIEELCEELNLRCWPSSANFVLIQVGAPAKQFVESMQRRGILVRDSSGNPGCEGCVRITVGTPSQMEGVLPAIRAAIAESHG